MNLKVGRERHRECHKSWRKEKYRFDIMIFYIDYLNMSLEVILRDIK